MMNKWIRAVALVVCLMLCLCACGDAGQSPATEATKESTEATQATEATEATVPDGKVVYSVTVQDEGGNPVAGAMVQLCLDSCMPARTDDQGVAQWTMEEADYKVSFVMMPEGYDYATDAQEFYFEDGEYELTLTVKAVA